MFPQAALAEGGIARFFAAGNRLEIEIALAWLVDETFLQHIALAQYRAVDEISRVLIGVGILRITVVEDVQVGLRHVHADVLVGRRTCNDAVKVFGVALRRHQALATTRRAALEVRVLRRLAVSLGDNHLGFFGQFMDGAVGEVDQFFRLAQCEHAVGSISCSVACVSARRCIATAQRHLHVAIALDGTGPAAIADGKKAAVPVSGGQP